MNSLAPPRIISCTCKAWRLNSGSVVFPHTFSPTLLFILFLLPASLCNLQMEPSLSGDVTCTSCAQERQLVKRGRSRLPLWRPSSSWMNSILLVFIPFSSLHYALLFLPRVEETHQPDEQHVMSQLEWVTEVPVFHQSAFHAFTCL